MAFYVKLARKPEAPPVGKAGPAKEESVAQTSSGAKGGNSGAASTPTSQAAPTSAPVKLEKPVLSKSSGNAPGSSVPAGALINFICNANPGLSCEVVLTDKNDASHVVKLGSKAVADNGHGEYFASWDWQAQSGDWLVRAVASNGQSTSESDQQSLRVQ